MSQDMLIPLCIPRLIRDRLFLVADFSPLAIHEF